MFMTPPKTMYRQQQPTRLGPLFQTLSVNGLGHSAYSTLSLVTTHHKFLSYAHCFSWPALLLTPLSPTYLIFSWGVTKLTWPKVTDIKNRKYTNCRHLCPYRTLQVSKSWDHWCAFGTMSNFEKRNLRSGHYVAWRGDLWGHRVIIFWKCVKLLAEQLWQISLSAKNEGGG